MKCDLRRKIVTWEGIHVSALRSQTVSTEVCCMVTLAQCQLVWWLWVIACGVEIGRRLTYIERRSNETTCKFVCFKLVISLK
jgi:DMSO/TMAO reductase YedYZ heme-binding membrane subunit